MEICRLEASVAFGTEPVALRPAGLHGVVSLELDLPPAVNGRRPATALRRRSVGMVPVLTGFGCRRPHR
jgi:hypothetical protein